jgi:hypothetical protein
MAEINIQIDIKNVNQIVEKEKGLVTGLFAGLFMDASKLKKQVEKKVCEEIIKRLELKIQEQLSSRGINADVVFSIKGEGS